MLSVLWKAKSINFGFYPIILKKCSFFVIIMYIPLSKAASTVIIMRVTSIVTRNQKIIVDHTVTSESDSIVFEAAVIIDKATTSARFWALFPF